MWLLHCRERCDHLALWRMWSLFQDAGTVEKVWGRCWWCCTAGLWDDCARPRYYNSKCWGTGSWWGNMGWWLQATGTRTHWGTGGQFASDTGDGVRWRAWWWPAGSADRAEWRSTARPGEWGQSYGRWVEFYVSILLGGSEGTSKAGCWFGTGDTVVSSRCDTHRSGSDVAEFQNKTHVVVSGAVEIATRSPVLRMGSWAMEEFVVGDTRLTQRQGDSVVPHPRCPAGTSVVRKQWRR